MPTKKPPTKAKAKAVTPAKAAPVKRPNAKRHAPDLDTSNYSMAKVKGRTEDVLSQKAKDRRQMFALAYVQNGCNGKRAAISIGIPPRSAAKQASEMMTEPYTRELVDQLKLDLLKDTSRLGNIVRLGQLREAHYDGHGASHGARVAAFGHLGRWFGLDKPAEGNGVVPSGVMEIPLASSLEEWTQASTLSQTRLLEDVRK